MRRAASAAIALGLVLLAAALPAGADLKVVGPPDGAVLTKTPVTLLGTGATTSIDITVTTPKTVGTTNGRLSGKAFTATIDLDVGENVILIKSGEERQRIVYTLASGEAPVVRYHFHPPVEEGECKACHPQGVGRTSPVTEAKLCQACHEPKNTARILHGPLGAGICSTCHDPHGSNNPRYLVMNVRALCIQCHAQSRSQSHIERSENKSCPECHDPHGSEKQYLLY